MRIIAACIVFFALATPVLSRTYDYYYRQGRQYYAYRQYEKSLKLLRRAFWYNQRDGNALFYMGLNYERLEDKNHAIIAYRMALMRRMHGRLRYIAYWKVVLHYRSINNHRMLIWYLKQFITFMEARRKLDIREDRKPSDYQMWNLKRMLREAYYGKRY